MKNSSSATGQFVQEALVFGEEGGGRHVLPRPSMCRPTWPMNAWYCIRDFAVLHDAGEVRISVNSPA